MLRVSGTRLLFEECQLPSIVTGVMAHDIGRPVVAAHLEISMLGRKPAVKDLDHLDCPLTEPETPGLLLATVARIALHSDDEITHGGFVAFRIRVFTGSMPGIAACRLFRRARGEIVRNPSPCIANTDSVFPQHQYDPFAAAACAVGPIAYCTVTDAMTPLRSLPDAPITSASVRPLTGHERGLHFTDRRNFWLRQTGSLQGVAEFRARRK